MQIVDDFIHKFILSLKKNSLNFNNYFLETIM